MKPLPTVLLCSLIVSTLPAFSQDAAPKRRVKAPQKPDVYYASIPKPTLFWADLSGNSLLHLLVSA